ncbi:LOW QUALITY PROTEIN: progesterone receptor [Thalassophryne amazonica]|uniref:LOW QUALITY PROTEIN: progesterone receptor n=1 Tax=Thalassophryne amazonica TaxID=390379 RepID=UPI001471319B|nr:LOW QUALITY PROTEIN: progesterone receptor [Thalassophryne amazonica]
MMEEKNGMSAISSSLADSTDTRASEFIEAGFSNTKLAHDPLTCVSSSARHFGAAGAGDGVFCDALGAPLAAKHFYDRGGEYVKCDSVPWEDFGKVPRAELITSESLVLPSTCKFIKDEKDSCVIMDAPCPTFDPSADMSAVDADRKQHVGESSSFVPAAGLAGSQNFLMDLNQSEPLNQVRTESRCAAVSAHPAPRWQLHASPPESQYWGQSTGAPENPFTHTGYEGIQTPGLSQRNPSPFSTFPGMPPQRLCVICGDEASGCHYGVLTCGSCKVFFKRAVEGHHSYLCAGRNDCIVDKIRRKNCPACRLRKCYQAGMMLGGRKLKRFGALKALGMSPSLMFQSQLAMSSDNQSLTSVSCIPSIREVQLNQHIINVLENIEPEIVYAGLENTKPDVPHLLLSSLNRLCEKQLLWIVKWSKCLPGFRNLHINDQMTLIQYSWMNLMVFSLGWRSFQNVTSEYLYFAPDLVLNQEQMRRTPIYDLCLAIQFIPQEFANLQVTREEFLCMKAIILLNTVPLEGLKSQPAFEEMRQNYIRELTRAIHMKEKGVVASSQRFYHLSKLMDAMHDIVKKVNLFCLSTFIQADAMKVEFPEMMSEVIASQLPKVLAGMVRPLLFHTK